MGGMITAPARTPSTRATCCFHGVASTSWPVFRSCRLLFAMVATANTMAVTNKANATSACSALTGRPDHCENADPGQRTVRGADQSGHVTAHRRDEEAHECDIDQSGDHEQCHV